MAKIDLSKDELYAILYVLQSENLPIKKGTEQNFVNAKLKLMSAYTFDKFTLLSEGFNEDRRD